MFALLLDFLLHFDHHLASFLAVHGALTYAVVTLIVLCETGLVITPFLPGDSLLFALGALAGRGLMDPLLLFILLAGAAILGDSLNFWVGSWLGSAVYSWDSRWIQREHLDRTRSFYARYGGQTIIIARFMPIVRTFAPFVAGIGAMNYTKFFIYNVIGGLLWVALFLGAGYFFGSLPFVENNFSLVILAIIALSIVPGVIGWVRSILAKRKKAATLT